MSFGILGYWLGKSKKWALECEITELSSVRWNHVRLLSFRIWSHHDQKWSKLVWSPCNFVKLILCLTSYSEFKEPKEKEKTKKPPFLTTIVFCIKLVMISTISTPTPTVVKNRPKSLTFSEIDLHCVHLFGAKIVTYEFPRKNCA